jgi:hypothetical protein
VLRLEVTRRFLVLILLLHGKRMPCDQTDHAKGGVVGDDDDGDEGDDRDDDNDDNDDNDDDGGCGGRDGHHRMRKGRGHDDTTIK